MTEAAYQEKAEAGGFGSSIYGGRPNFGIKRALNDEGRPEIALYELLPDEQAYARLRRHQHVGQSITVTSHADAFTTDSVPKTRWSWGDWSAVEIGTLRGSRLQTILPLIRETLEEYGLDHDPVTTTVGGEVYTPEGAGVKLALGFIGVKDLRRIDRMRAVIRGVSQMSTEECYYWYAKCRSPSSPNGVKALRTLLSDHIE